MLIILKNKKVWIPLLILAIVATGFIISRNNAVEEIIVETEKVQRRNIVHKVNASGKIQPEEEVQITSTITGWITEITVAEGDTVQPGQHLISIDEKQYRPRYNQALSQVKSSEANMRKVQSQMDRTKTLFSQNLISKQELEQLEASYQIALSQAEQARANLLSAEDELSKTRLTAPKYGIVTSLTKEEGEMALGGMFNPGVLMTVADLSHMEVLVDVNENDVV
ncbi:MAG: efflux RND transporter periplasmic adaptor subunit, partial [Candidatus Marinimicrobia bacterium]|nr:efflux RND transporter periplasmic adaptor subunit [Candidatus Neomarinimicrobiota bacterium]